MINEGNSEKGINEFGQKRLNTFVFLNIESLGLYPLQEKK